MRRGAGRTVERLSASSLRRIYDRDYYHGATSGYPDEGYASAHPHWEPWLDIIGRFCPSGRLLDLGCAYGYLVDAAGRAGFKAFGADVSRFALRQEPRLADRLIESRLEHLPFPTGWATVVCLFDVLEHLEHPLECFTECARVLAPGGLLAGATPDPLRFSRDEATHLSERPPSYWLEALRTLGFTVRFRFSGEDYNFQFLAARAGTDLAGRLQALQQGSFSGSSAFLSVRGALEAAPRDGYLASEPAAGRLPDGPAAFYVLNPTSAPLTFGIDLELTATPGFSTLQLRLDSLVVGRVELTTERTSHRLVVDDLPLAAGGHHLWFELEPGGPTVELKQLRMAAQDGDAARLVESLPFDLFQRYRLAAEIADILGPETVLDVGGVLGDEDGHLATSADFFGPDREIVTTDRRYCDHPHHEIAAAGRQPFADESMDLVVSLDVLEHLPPAERDDFLAELRRVARHWVVVAAPTGRPEVEEAERLLGSSLLKGHQFLAEHAEHGLPDTETTHRLLEAGGWSVLELPSGYLPHWVAAQALTQALFSSRDSRLWTSFNRLYNRHVFGVGQREPAYRRFWIAGRHPLTESQREALKGLRSTTSGDELAAVGEDAELTRALMEAVETGQRSRRALNDAQFIANARSEGLEILRRELEETSLWKLALRRLRKRLKG